MAQGESERPSGSPLRAVVGLALLLALVLATLFIVQRLHHAAVIQDCVASGRTNCAPASQRENGR